MRAVGRHALRWRDRAGLPALRREALRAVGCRALCWRDHAGLPALRREALRAVGRCALGGRGVGRGSALWRGALWAVLYSALCAGARWSIGGRLLFSGACLGLAGLAGSLRSALSRAGSRPLLILMIQIIGIIATATKQRDQAYRQQAGWETGILLFVGRRLLKSLHGQRCGGRGRGRAGAWGQNGFHRRGGRAQRIEGLIGSADQGRILPYRIVKTLQRGDLALLMVVAADRDGGSVGAEVFRALKVVGQLAH